MARPFLALMLTCCLVSTAFTAAPPRPTLSDGTDGIVRGGPVGGVAKAVVDTTLLMGPTGSGAPYIGDFEGRQWNGWSSVDGTDYRDSHWHAATYRAVAGVYSAWCGDLGIPSCDGGVTDPEGGYGNNWNDLLEWRGTVLSAAAPTTVTVTATMNVDIEPAYDYLYLSLEKADLGYVDLNSWDGLQLGVAVNEVATYQPDEYMGENGDEVVVLFRFRSDGAFSDEDCLYPGAGAAQVDDVTIATDNGAGTGGVVDFEDGTLGPFTTWIPVVGNFGQLWKNLRDLDPCVDNWSWQVAFIDDGQVVPGTGGTQCIDWCYGPEGYVVNHTGGLIGPEAHLDNRLESPVMTWPNPAHGGGLVSFDVYRHQETTVDSPGIFFGYGYQFTKTGDPADMGPFAHSAAQIGGPWYDRVEMYLNNMENTTHVQLRLSVQEFGYIWGFVGDNATPAPYFDNVRMVTFPLAGPDMEAFEYHLAQDAFPASGTLDLADPGALSCRFDMARNISPPEHLRNDPGDSVVFRIYVGYNTVQEGSPQMHYRVKRNPLFDPYRTDPTPAVGSLACEEISAGYEYSADLPDEGWLFPGDIVHYYFTASDRDPLTDEVRTAIMPADTTGFSVFYDPQGYDPRFTMRCLPSVTDLAGDQPEILFWNDFGRGVGFDEWYHALRMLGLFPIFEYCDYYTTQSPSSGVGNGLGGRATAAQLAGYDYLLYGSGDLTLHTLGNGDFQADPSQDLQVLTAWLDTGGKGLFATGDGLVHDLNHAGMPGQTFNADVLQVDYVDFAVRDLIGGQASPLVLPVAGNPVFADGPVPLYDVSSWIAFGGCPGLHTFDAVTPRAGAQILAEFADPGGNPGAYPYSAATLATGVGTAGTSQVISLPYDLGFIRTDPNEREKVAAIDAARKRVLGQVLAWFGFGTDPITLSHVPGAAAFAVRQHPNPFNPVTTISYTAPRPGRLTVKVYDLRGRLVRTVFDDQVTVSGSVDWDGTDGRGAQAASGVYFYEVRLGGEVEIGKMALIK